MNTRPELGIGTCRKMASKIGNILKVFSVYRYNDYSADKQKMMDTMLNMSDNSNNIFVHVFRSFWSEKTQYMAHNQKLALKHVQLKPSELVIYK